MSWNVVSWNVDTWLRAVAGTIVLLSLALGWWLHPAWLLVTAFVGVNLVQSAFTGWCPLMTVLRKVGVRG
ncbi:MAG TPA: DUF2892 domain-containing protein [Thermoanaerobaculia bacterium]|nr:DUF2892 domain-containing protein [Thermoanaerobaculia bacterium]